MLKICFRVAAAAAFAIAAIGPANAQATRTWVSGVGDDVNPCSRTAPCKTFAGAISKTAAGGEINCLDPGGFGTVTITKSITIDCTGTFGSTLNSGGINGFVINDSLSATPGQADVILRGLSINGAGTTPGLNGVRFVSGRSLTMEDVFIQNQRSGSGISIQPGNAAMRFHAENVTVTNGATGILFQPTGTGSIRATLHNVRVWNNTGNGMTVQNLTASTGIFVTADNSVFSQNSNGISLNTLNATTPITMMLANSTVALNPTQGIIASGAGSVIRVGDTSIHANGFGVILSGGAIINTYGTNRLNGNAPDGTFTAPAINQQ